MLLWRQKYRNIENLKEHSFNKVLEEIVDTEWNFCRHYVICKGKQPRAFFIFKHLKYGKKEAFYSIDPDDYD